MTDETKSVRSVVAGGVKVMGRVVLTSGVIAAAVIAVALGSSELSRRADAAPSPDAAPLIPVLTIMGLQFSFLLAGAIIIENVFYLPGLGRLVFQAISSRDLIVVESVVMLLVFAVVLVNFAVDLTYALVDPRLRRRR